RLVDSKVIVGGISEGHTPAVAVDAEVDKVPTSDRQVAVDIAALGDIAHVGIPPMRTLAKNLEATGGGRGKAEDQPQKGGFPTAVRPQHGDEFSRVHGEAGVSPDEPVRVGRAQAIGDDGGSTRTAD